MLRCKINSTFAEAKTVIFYQIGAENFAQNSGEAAAVPVIRHTPTVITLANEVTDGIVIDVFIPKYKVRIRIKQREVLGIS